jgi:farnesol dehydrogenase
MKTLLTGATGYLGGRLALRMESQGRAVRLLVRNPESARAVLGGRFELAAGNLCDASSLDRAVDGCEAVIHTASLVKNWVKNAGEFERVNIGGSWSLCEAAIKARVKTFVYTSSFLALGPSRDGRPMDESAFEAPRPERFFNSYHSTKYRAARLLQAFVPRGLNLVTLFPTVLFGPGAETDGNHVGKILRWVKEGRFPGLIGSGRQLWNLAFIEDVVSGHLEALEKGRPGDRFILGGTDRALEDLVILAASKLSVPAPQRKLSYGLCHLVASLEELKARVFGATPRITHGEVDIYRHDWTYSSERAEQVLGYQMTPFEQAFDVTIDSVMAES